MSGYNLPPECSVSDIPGNRPEDFAEEALFEAIDNALNPMHEVGRSSYDVTVEAIRELIDKAYEDGYNAGRRDEAEANYYISGQAAKDEEEMAQLYKQANPSTGKV